MDESRLFFDTRAELLQWTDNQQQWMREREAVNKAAGTGERIREQLAEHRVFMEGIKRRAQAYAEVQHRGQALEEHAPPGEKRQVEEANAELTARWEELTRGALKRQRSLEEALIQSGKFDEVLAELLEWLSTKLPPLEAQLGAGKYLGKGNLMRHFPL